VNLAKVAAVIIGAIVVFFVLGFVIHAIAAILGAVVLLAIVGGGGYVAYKLVSGSRRRELRRGNRY
jgi:uncharacterized membrane protein